MRAAKCQAALETQPLFIRSDVKQSSAEDGANFSWDKGRGRATNRALKIRLHRFAGTFLPDFSPPIPPVEHTAR